MFCYWYSSEITFTLCSPTFTIISFSLLLHATLVSPSAATTDPSFLPLRS